MAKDAARAGGVGSFGDIGTVEGRCGMDRDHDGQPVDRDRLVIGRTCPAAAAFDTGFRVSQPHAGALQLVDQLFGRKAHRRLLRRKAQARAHDLQGRAGRWSRRT